MSVTAPDDGQLKYDMDWPSASLVSMLAPIAVFPKIDWVDVGYVIVP
jgi:hypothetical protein